MIPRPIRHPAQPPRRPVQPALRIPHRGVRLLEYLLMQVQFVADSKGEVVLPRDAGAEEGEASVLVCRVRRRECEAVERGEQGVPSIMLRCCSIKSCSSPDSKSASKLRADPSGCVFPEGISGSGLVGAGSASRYGSWSRASCRSRYPSSSSSGSCSSLYLVSLHRPTTYQPRTPGKRNQTHGTTSTGLSSSLTCCLPT